MHPEIKQCTMHPCYVTHAAGTLISKFKQNEYTMGRNSTYRSFCMITSYNLKSTMCELCKCVISLLQIAIGNILNPIGMLYNAMWVQRQNTPIP